MQLFDDSQARLSDLESWRSASNESLTPNALSRKLNVILASAGRTLSFVAEEIPKQGKLLFSSNYDTERVLREVNYISLSKVTVPALTGMKVTYHSLALVLTESVIFLSDIKTEAFRPAERLLNQLYGSPEELRGTFKFPEFDQLQNRYKKMVKIRETLGGCFDKGKQNTYQNFSDVFINNSEVKQTEDLIRALNLMIQKMDIDSIRKAMHGVETAANDLHKLIVAKDEYIPSSFIASKVTELLFNIAEEAEFLGAVLTYHQSLTHTFQEMQKVLSQKLK